MTIGIKAVNLEMAEGTRVSQLSGSIASIRPQQECQQRSLEVFIWINHMSEALKTFYQNTTKGSRAQ
jgi:hypothetical protein